jgi:hypothetical protein
LHRLSAIQYLGDGLRENETYQLSTATADGLRRACHRIGFFGPDRLNPSYEVASLRIGARTFGNP